MVQIIKQSSKLARGIYLFIYLRIYFSANGPVGQFIIEGVGEEGFKCVKQSKEEENLTFATAP